METNLYTSNSKGRGHTWIRLVVFFVVLSLLLSNIGGYYESLAEQNQNLTDYRRAWDEFYQVPRDSLDLIYIGSSHAYCTFDPELIDEGLGTNSFNFGSPLQYPDSTYYVLQEVFKYQKPKTVIYEIYWDTIDDEFDLSQADAVIGAVDREEFERRFIREAFPLAEISKYLFKTVRYQKDAFNFWDQRLKEKVEEHIEPVEKKPETKGVSYHKGRGFIYSDIVIPKSEFLETNQFLGFDGADWDFNERQKAYIEKIVDFSRKRDVDIIFVTAPIANVSMEHIDNYDVLHSKIANFADELGVDYRDYNIVNREKDLFVNENFRDDAHLNYSGVEIFTEDFLAWYRSIR